jgi:hypothetical protein
MKSILISLAILLCCHPSRLLANVGSPGETHGTTETILITTNGMVSMINIACIGTGNPLEWAFGLGVAAGSATIIYALTAEHLEHETALPVSGLLALGTSVLSLGFRKQGPVHIESTWIDRSPGLALVVDF